MLGPGRGHAVRDIRPWGNALMYAFPGVRLGPALFRRSNGDQSYFKRSLSYFGVCIGRGMLGFDVILSESDRKLVPSA